MILLVVIRNGLIIEAGVFYGEVVLVVIEELRVLSVVMQVQRRAQQTSGATTLPRSLQRMQSTFTFHHVAVRDMLGAPAVFIASISVTVRTMLAFTPIFPIPFQICLEFVHDGKLKKQVLIDATF